MGARVQLQPEKCARRLFMPPQRRLQAGVALFSTEKMLSSGRLPPPENPFDRLLARTA
jgi:hypothetical protein